MNPLDAYVNKSVPFKFRGQDMSFELSHALFSSFDIDQGSRLLLKAVARNVDETVIGSIIDIGSGTGVLGVACARGYPGASLWMRDRDALACAFSRRNAARNKVRPEAVDHALFLSGIENQLFDLVLCNVPAKAGPPVLDRFLRDLPGIVSGRGYGAVVVVQPIAEAALESIAASGAAILHTETGTGHVAVIFRRGAAVSPLPELQESPEAEESQGVYLRSEQAIRGGKAIYRLHGYWGLPEFDTPSFETDLAIDLCDKILDGSSVKRALFINPGIGRVACHVRSRKKDAVIDLCGRDALELAASYGNIALNRKKDAVDGMSVADATGLPDSAYDLIVEFVELIPRVDTLENSWNQAERLLRAGASYIAVMPSSVMDRFARHRLKIFNRMAERKKKGFACASWRHG